MFTIILEEIRESRVETNKRLDNIENRIDRIENRMDNIENKMDNLENRMDNLEREVKETKQLVQNFKWDIDLLTDKQAKSELAINRIEKRLES